MFKRLSLLHEILLVLLIKLALLYGLWALCFAHPVDKQLQPKDVASHLFASTS
jgi:hypothetical protein